MLLTLLLTLKSLLLTFLIKLCFLVKTETWCDTDEIRAMIALQVQVAMETVLPEVNENNRYQVEFWTDKLLQIASDICRLLTITLVQVLIVTASLVESVLKLYEELISRLPQHDTRAVTLQAGNETPSRDRGLVGHLDMVTMVTVLLW